MLAGALAMGGGSAFAGSASQGKAVFAQCKVCHATDKPTKKVGPSLMHLFKRAKLVNGKPMSEQNVRAMIERGGNGMPGYKQILSAQQMSDVIAYLKTL